jgi:hypothetical protein
MANPFNFGQPALFLDEPQGALSGFSDPRTIGLLSMATGLLQAGGPSRTPVSTGQALSQGLNAGIGGYSQARNQMAENAMNQARMAMLAQQARKAKMDADLTEQAMAGGALHNSGDPDQLEMLGTRLALGGHPGGATLIAQAEKIRALRQNQQAVDSMRSAPGTLGAGVTTTSPQGQALLGNLTGDVSFDQSILEAQNDALNSNPGLKSLPIAAAKPGLFGPLMASPFVRNSAQALQNQLDASKGIPAQTWLTQFNNLQQQDQTATSQAIAREENATVRREIAERADATRRELAGQSDETRRLIAQTSAGRRDETRQNLEEQRRFERERSLANDFNRLTADYRVILPAFQGTARYMASGKYNSAGDRDLAFAFAKTLDPRDRVGVNDIRDINKLGNVPERIQQAIVGLAEGKELPERVRREMFDVMRNRWAVANEQQQQIEDEYESRARQYMLAPDRVVQRFAVRGAKPNTPQPRGATGGWSAKEKR